MKRIHLVFFSILMAVLAFSCASISVSSNTIPAPHVSLADLTPQSYTVLGTVTGTGKVLDGAVGAELSGDTGKYGTFGDVSAVFVPMAGEAAGTPLNARDKAYGNAVYALIESAEAKGADAIIFIRTKTIVTLNSTGKEIEVTVTGTAIKLK